MSTALKLGLPLFGILYVATLAFSWADIERDIAQRTHQSLHKQGMDWVQVDTEDRGRAVLLSGVAPSSEARDAAVRQAGEVWGVRAVESTIRFMLNDPNVTYPAHLQLHRQGQTIRVAGVLHDAVDTAWLAAFIGRRLGGEVDAGGLQRASNVSEAVWLKDFKYFLYDLDDSADIRIMLRDNRLVLDGPIHADQIGLLMKDARSRFADEIVIENRMVFSGTQQPGRAEPDSLEPDLCQLHMNTLVHHQTINFAPGSVAVHADSLGLVQQVAKVAKVCEDNRIRVEGHTDNTGDAQQNLLLSRQRAESVLRLLIQSGVNQDRLEAQGYGMDRPVESNHSEQGRAKNRRIEFRVLLNS